MGRRLRVVQVTFYADARRRDAESLLIAWPTLSGVAAGVARAGVDVFVVQAAHARRTLERDGVQFEFVNDERAAPLQIGLGMRIPRRPARLIDQVLALSP